MEMPLPSLSRWLFLPPSNLTACDNGKPHRRLEIVRIIPLHWKKAQRYLEALVRDADFP
jgi:hypothetical protein